MLYIEKRANDFEEVLFVVMVGNRFCRSARMFYLDHPAQTR